jgi:fucose permease
VSPFRLACLAYLGAALPGSTVGLLWPSMRVSLGEPIGALGILLAIGVASSVLASAAAGRVLSRVNAGTFLSAGVLLTGLALGLEGVAPALWVVGAGFAVFGIGFGAIDAAVNAHAASHFGARQVNWMHASYGLGATIGPLLVTGLLPAGLSWRWAYEGMAIVQLIVAVVFLLERDNWEGAARAGSDDSGPAGAPAARRRVPVALLAGALTFAAAEAGLESGAGIWGYTFLTAGRGLSHVAAGLAVSAYWATMFAGRVALGPVAERAGPGRVLAWAVAGVALGAALMALPGPAALAVIGLMGFGLAAAPVFPLFTVTTGQRLGADLPGTTQAVSMQVAASAAGSAALPAGLGLAIGALGAGVAAPLLLVLSLGMCGVYGLLARSARPGQGARPSSASRRSSAGAAADTGTAGPKAPRFRRRSARGSISS